MASKYPRHPISNFFIKKDLQVRLIAKIVLSVLAATIIFAATMLIMYQLSYQSAAFYQVTLSSGDTQIGDRLNIVTIILPSLCISAVVNILLAAIVGLYSSRKYAVPIFKLEKWARLVSDGKLTAVLQFREQDEMRDLCNICNTSTAHIRDRFQEIQQIVKSMTANPSTIEDAKKLSAILNKIEFESEAIEVNTSQYQM